MLRKMIPHTLLRFMEQGFRIGRGFFWQAWYLFPAKKLKVIAVTGTNGKTTTSCYINEVLKYAGLKTAIYTTAIIEIDGRVEPNKTHYTLVKQRLVQQFFSRARKTGVDWVVLEVTSHAIDQHRILGTTVDIAVMTNLTQDHLDYHGTMEEYARVKSLLFGGRFHPRISVLNIDDERYEFFAKKAEGRVITYGKNKEADVRLLSPNGVGLSNSATIDYKDENYALKTNLRGEFNLYNSAAAVCAGLAVGIDMSVATKGVEKLVAVPGRMEKIEEGQPFEVFVDFAYTPDALEKALRALKDTTKGSVRIVFGATGDRDKSKRPLMGQVVAKWADRIYLTDDETYTEDPKQIREDVFEGIINAKAEDKTKVIASRTEAIERAFKEASPGDAILLAGLGHETTRNIGGKQVDWDERQVARELLSKMKK